MTPGRGALPARSAGAGVQLMANDGAYATLRLRAGGARGGRAGGRAGGGEGGGEGRTKGGRHPVSPWGTPTKGYQTRANKRTDGMIVRRRK